LKKRRNKEEEERKKFLDILEMQVAGEEMIPKILRKV